MRRATKQPVRVRGSEQEVRSLVTVPRAWRRRVQRTANLFESFYHALQGLKVAFQDERNLKIQALMAVLSVGLAVVLRFDPLSWAMLFLAIGLVITAELLNTAIERAVDMFTGGEYNNLARDAKDIAAGAVVCASVTSIAIGASIYLPRIYGLLVAAH